MTMGTSKDMTPYERVVVRALQTSEGQEAFRKAIQQAGAKAADHFPEGSKGEALGRMLAGLPVKRS